MVGEDLRPQVTDHGPRITDYGLRTEDDRRNTKGSGLSGSEATDLWSVSEAGPSGDYHLYESEGAAWPLTS